MRATADSTEVFADDIAANGLLGAANGWYLKRMALMRSAGTIKQREGFTYTAGNFVHIGTLCEIYQDWCQTHGFPYQSRRTSTMLVTSIRHRMPWVIARHGRIEGTNRRGLDGIPLQPGDRQRMLDGRWQAPEATIHALPIGGDRERSADAT